MEETRDKMCNSIEEFVESLVESKVKILNETIENTVTTLRQDIKGICCII
jgi:uncharacterized membrane-anchored protein YjiN (DUF445 family)